MTGAYQIGRQIPVHGSEDIPGTALLFLRRPRVSARSLAWRLAQRGGAKGGENGQTGCGVPALHSLPSLLNSLTSIENVTILLSQEALSPFPMRLFSNYDNATPSPSRTWGGRTRAAGASPSRLGRTAVGLPIGESMAKGGAIGGVSMPPTGTWDGDAEDPSLRWGWPQANVDREEHWQGFDGVTWLLK